MQFRFFSHHHLLVVYATLRKVVENPAFIRPLGQSLTKIAVIDAVAIEPVLCITGRARKTISTVHQVDVQSKHAQNDEHLNGTKPNRIGRIIAMQIYLLFVPGREVWK